MSLETFFGSYWAGVTVVLTVTMLIVIVRQFPKNTSALPGKVVAMGLPIGVAMTGAGRVVDSVILTIAGLALLFRSMFAARLFVQK